MEFAIFSSYLITTEARMKRISINWLFASRSQRNIWSEALALCHKITNLTVDKTAFSVVQCFGLKTTPLAPTKHYSKQSIQFIYRMWNGFVDQHSITRNQNYFECIHAMFICNRFPIISHPLHAASTKLMEWLNMSRIILCMHTMLTVPHTLLHFIFLWQYSATISLISCVPSRIRWCSQNVRRHTILILIETERVHFCINWKNQPWVFSLTASKASQASLHKVCRTFSAHSVLFSLSTVPLYLLKLQPNGAEFCDVLKCEMQPPHIIRVWKFSENYFACKCARLLLFILSAMPLASHRHPYATYSNCLTGKW